MSSVLRFWKLCFTGATFRNYESSDKNPKDEKQGIEKPKVEKKQKVENSKRRKGWGCVDSCCWLIGCMCTTWWVMLFLYHCCPVNLGGLKGPEPPGVRLKNEGLTALHPVVLIPGMVTGGLELWEGRPCSQGLFRKRIWGGSFTEILKRFV